MNVLIICAAGMSSSALAASVRNELSERGMHDIKVGACGSNQAAYYARQADLVLLAPQISYMRKTIEKEGITKVCLMSASAYGLKDAKVITDQILNPDRKEEERTPNTFVQFISEKIGSNRWLLSIKDGMIDVLAVTVMGSVFSLLQSLPISIWTTFLSNTGLDSVFATGRTMTNGLFSVYLTLTISYHIAKYKNRNGTGVGLTAAVCFFMVTQSQRTTSYLDLSYLGPKGVFTAILVSIFTGEMFTFIDDHVKFKPDSRMPKKIGESFRSLIPSCICAGTVILFLILFSQFTDQTIPSVIDQGMMKYVSSIVGKNGLSALAVSFISNVLWCFGLHGGNITSAVTTPIYSQLSLINLEAWTQGNTLPNMVVDGVSHLYLFGGAGSTLPLSCLMLFLAKSDRLKSLGKITVPMGIFFINEPILFGLPIVMNPSLFLPFIMIPFISGVLTFGAMYIGLIPYMIGFDLPWTTPPVIYGFIEGGLPLALWQIAMFVLQVVLWYPVFKRLDNQEVSKQN